ncbi:hypothetical protein BAOM_4594 [Peribacillus asahii]|uniref:Uncharacterized protein n=1 Tax=Peribacillus asahii TaxID=228899 RepID=A0A3T0KY00_9BACI|nr:hypothetical protein [Peribacillus asahii]AZV45173.1 hypothetical protein BAOM_4594 [Peribacillus asahii]
MKTLEEMRKFVAEYKAEHGKFRPRIPTTEAHRATLEWIGETVRAVLIRYAKLVHDSGQVPDIETAKLEAYISELEEIVWTDNYNVSGHARVLSWALAMVINRHKTTAPQLVRNIYMVLDSTKGGVGNAFR